MELLLSSGRHHRGPDTDDAHLADLVAEVRAGDEKALASLYEATVSQMLGIAIGILKDRELAEEAVMEAYLQVWRQADRYQQPRAGVRAWLTMMARSRAIDARRARFVRTSKEQPLELQMEPADVASDPESRSIESDAARRVRGALGELPPSQRRAIEAAFFGGLTHSEVATAMGEPLGTVKTWIRRGLTQLRVILAHDLETFH